MVGSGKDDEPFKQRIRELGLEEMVHLTGYVPHRDIVDWIQAGDIMVFPTHYEGVPNAVLETMACGKPVVATAVGGIPEIIQHGKTGYLVEKGNLPELGKAIEHLLRDTTVCHRIGTAAREFIRTHASWTRNAQDMKTIYQDLIYGPTQGSIDLNRMSSLGRELVEVGG